MTSITDTLTGTLTGTLAAGASLDAAQLEEQLVAGADLRVLDVRTPAEFETSHIRGSYNVPLDRLAEHCDDLSRHVEVPLVVVCRTGNRARQAQSKLASAGLGHLHVLEGGIAAWETSGRPLVRGEEKWELERQVRLVAGGAVLAGIAASLRWPRARFFSGAIGAGLTVAALSDTCAMGAALSKLPYNRARSCEVDHVVAELCGR